MDINDLSLAIIVVGYNRLDSIKRLVESLDEALYSDGNVTLIFSIDFSGSNEIEIFAKKFDWKGGKKRIRTFSERQGLRKHILSCGDFLDEFDGVVILEDDVIVAPGFYHYVKAAVRKYYNNERVAGISLYSPEWNNNVQCIFQPAYSQYDNYFLQFPQSWGQVWMRNQWNCFIKWYKLNQNKSIANNNVPEFVSGWPISSWLKYHVRFCVDNDMFFVCPYQSFSTCFSDAGEHFKSNTSKIQVAMLQEVKFSFNFCDFNDKGAVKYDVFFERNLSNVMWNNISYDNICMDLYSSKKDYQNKKYLVTSKSLPYKIIGTFGCVLRPHEINLLKDISGDMFRMYSLNEPCKRKKNKNSYELQQYYFRLYNKGTSLVRYLINGFLRTIRNLFYFKKNKN